MHKFSIRILICAVLMMFSAGKAAGADELKGVVFRVFCSAQMAPFAFINNNWQSPEGIEVDIFLELKNRLGFSLDEDRIVPVPQAVALDFLKKDKADIIMGAVASTYEREKIFNFSKVYSQSALGVVKRNNDSSITSFSALKGRRVAVEAGSDAHSYVSSILKDSQIIVVPHITKGFLMVQMGQADVLVADRFILSYFVDTVPSMHLSLLEDAFNLDAGRMALVFDKQFEYKAIIDSEIDKMHADGTIDRINRKWRTKSSY